MARREPKLELPDGSPRCRFLPRARATPTPPSSLARGATARPELPGRPLHPVAAFALGVAARQYRALRPTAAHWRARPVPRSGARGSAGPHPGSLGPCAGRASLEARIPHGGADPAGDGAPELPPFSGSVMGAKSRLAGKLLWIEAGIDIAPVQQRGTGPLVKDVVACQVLMTIDSP